MTHHLDSRDLELSDHRDTTPRQETADSGTPSAFPQSGRGTGHSHPTSPGTVRASGTTQSLAAQFPLPADANLGVSSEDFSSLHPLQQPWTFWFDRRPNKGKRMPGEKEAYEQNLIEIGTFSTVEGFWQYYNHMTKPSRLENNANVSLFKQGVKPMWEDEANQKGGKWIIQFRSPDRQLLDSMWEEICLGMIGEYINDTDEICGAVMSKRSRGDKIAVWNRTRTNGELLEKLAVRLQEFSSARLNMEYQHHEDSLRTGASYTNPNRFSLPPTPTSRT